MKRSGALPLNPVTFRRPRLGNAMGGLGFVLAGFGCAQLLDIPEEPRVRDSLETSTQASEDAQRVGAAGREELPAYSGGFSVGPSPSQTAESTSEQSAVEPSRALDTSEDNSELDGTAQAQQVGSSDAGAAEFIADAGPLDAGLPEATDAGLPPEVPPVVPTDEGCPLGGLVGPDEQCYLVLSEPLPWVDARASCQAVGASWDLASIRNEAVDAFVLTLSDEELWLGASDLQEEGTWLWVEDGTVFWEGDAEQGVAVDGEYVRWNATEPNGGGNSGCLRTVPSLQGTWADLECEFARLALCHGPRQSE